MDLYQAIHARRSIRKFAPTPIPEEILERMLSAMQAAPSGKNAQPWRFIVVREAGYQEEDRGYLHIQHRQWEGDPTGLDRGRSGNHRGVR